METIHLRVEKRRRGGKTVTVLEGFTRHADEMKEMARRFKSACGAGGTVKDGRIEIQGDFHQKVSSLLHEWGFFVKGG